MRIQYIRKLVLQLKRDIKGQAVCYSGLLQQAVGASEDMEVERQLHIN